MEKHRSLRGSITSKVKESIFAIFGENELPAININASAAEISRWKSLPSVRNCYDNLFQQTGERNTSRMSRILARVWPNSAIPSQMQQAYAIAICQIFLNPDEKNIKITKKLIKRRLQSNLVSFADFCK